MAKLTVLLHVGAPSKEQAETDGGRKFVSLTNGAYVYDDIEAKGVKFDGNYSAVVEFEFGTQASSVNSDAVAEELRNDDEVAEQIRRTVNSMSLDERVEALSK